MTIIGQTLRVVKGRAERFGRGHRAGQIARLQHLFDARDQPLQQARAAEHIAAGLARHAPALDTTPEDYDATMALNLRAAYVLTREVARGLIAAGKPGSLMNISSQMGHVGGPDRAVYCANKHALDGMTKAMALEWAPQGIRVNTVCPTFIRTPLAEQILAIPELRAWILSKIKLGRVEEIEDVMGPVVFLASDAAALITCTHLIVDGGWTAE